jgi:biopolymer transport protein ExbB/TolQ
VAGLVVAIPAAIAYNYFAGRLQLFMSELEGLLERVHRLVGA